MESSSKARKIIGRCLLVLLLVALAVAGWSQWQSPLLHQLTMHTDTPLEITVLTNPAMFITYTPATRQAQVRILNEKKHFNNPQERISKLLESEHITAQLPIKYIEPAQTDRTLFWDEFKYRLARWRFNPLLAAQVAQAYLAAWHHRRTNLSPAEFALLALELTQLEENDFTVRFPPQKRGKKKATAPVSEPLPVARSTQQDRPIIVEILNASGRKGLASELTQYLREQNEKGLLRVDVWQYDNYPSVEQTSWLEDYSGRQVQVKQLGTAIGITGEIRAGNAPNVLCDTRIILGKDFKMPL